MNKQEMEFKLAHENIMNQIEVRFNYKRNKLDIFEDWMESIAMFILAIPLIIVSPLIILAQRVGGAGK